MVLLVLLLLVAPAFAFVVFPSLNCIAVLFCQALQRLADRAQAGDIEEPWETRACGSWRYFRISLLIMLVRKCGRCKEILIL